ncbi:putative DNA repair protein [Pseudobdellovibrio exovorus JSS]|uniref:Putative DNA repair protein n=2 Tax=Pseudobdellovibrio exovorus TaxID=453816 RepID=M4V9B8_9BACT|nr:putative DNA repair protein [Pseudobdellovibrio exovorus JSS]
MSISPCASFYFLLLRHLFQKSNESFWVIYLDSALEFIAIQRMATGQPNFCLVKPQKIFKSALLLDAQALVLAHNHPSLNVQPTPADIRMTQQLIKKGHLLQLPILDHIIFTDKNYFSFKENNLI